MESKDSQARIASALQQAREFARRGAYDDALAAYQFLQVRYPDFAPETVAQEARAVRGLAQLGDKFRSSELASPPEAEEALRTLTNAAESFPDLPSTEAYRTLLGKVSQGRGEPGGQLEVSAETPATRQDDVLEIAEVLEELGKQPQTPQGAVIYSSEASPAKSSKRFVTAAAGAFVLASLALRLYGIGENTLWFDELAEVRSALAPLSQVLDLKRVITQDPPGFVLFLHFWAYLGTSEVMLRLPSALLNAAATGVIFLVGARLIGTWGGIMATALHALAPIQINYSQLVAEYPFTALLAGLGLLTVESIVAQRTNRRTSPWWRDVGPWIVLGVIASFMFTWHYSLFFIVAGLFFVTAMHTLQSPRKDSLKLLIAVGIFVGIAVLVWGISLSYQIPRSYAFFPPMAMDFLSPDQWPRAGNLLYKALAFQFIPYQGMEWLMAPTLAFFAVFLVVSAVRAARFWFSSRLIDFKTFRIYSYFFLSWGLAILAAATGHYMLLGRYFVALAVPFYLILGYAFSSFPVRQIGRGAFLVTVLVLLFAFPKLRESLVIDDGVPRAQNVRTSFEALSHKVQPEQGIYLPFPGSEWYMWYYYKGPDVPTTGVSWTDYFKGPQIPPIRFPYYEFESLFREVDQVWVVGLWGKAALQESFMEQAICDYAVTDTVSAERWWNQEGTLAYLFSRKAQATAETHQLSLEPRIHWTMDAKAFDGSKLRDSRGENGAVAVGSPLSLGKEGARQYLQFNGRDNFLDAGPMPDLDLESEMTVAAWVKVNSYEAHRPIIEKSSNTVPGGYNGGYRLTVLENGFHFSVAVDGVWYNTWLGGTETGIWRHIVGTYNPGVVRIYQNGVLAQKVPIPGGCQPMTPARGVPLSIGGYSWVQGYNFKGAIDDLRIYNRALDPKEVMELYKTSLPR